jgi:catechol 2,3-dioxygenase-like lactoylglutathione lyase family enzyme
MQPGSIHHIGLSVRDVEAAEAAFYGPVLGFLGYQRVESPGHVSFWRDPKSGPTIHLVRAADAAEVPENDHCAFSVPSREAVESLHDLLVKQDIEVLGPPADYPQFGHGHYAVFFRDPDGRLVEVLHRPAPTAALSTDQFEARDQRASEVERS